MANQYKSALDHAIEELADQCTEAGITLDNPKRIIYWRILEVYIEPGTTKIECTRKLKRLILADRKMKAKEAQPEQGVLV